MVSRHRFIGLGHEIQIRGIVHVLDAYIFSALPHPKQSIKAAESAYGLLINRFQLQTSTSISKHVLPTSTSQRSLTTIPPELQLSITSYLDPMSRHLFSNANPSFRNLLPPLTHRQLLDDQNSTYARNHRIQTYGVFLRLRPNTCFAADLLTKFDSLLCSDRFCIGYGTRPLTNNPEEDYNRFPLGARWTVDGMRCGRCARCKEC